MAGGYVLALLVAWAIVTTYIALTDGPDRQASGGMYAFGDSLLFLALFGVAAVPATGAALYFVRPFHAFWRALSVAALAITATGVAAVGVYSQLGSPAPVLSSSRGPHTRCFES